MWIYNDGGRLEAGYVGDVGDCVARSIAIATEKPYQEVYDALFSALKEYSKNHRDKTARQIAKGRGKTGTTPRNGVSRKVYESYLESIGWRFVPCMTIGSGCKVHLRPEELPSGRIIARVSGHLCAVIDGTINDTYDPSRNGNRCVYGYYEKTPCI